MTRKRFVKLLMGQRGLFRNEANAVAFLVRWWPPTLQQFALCDPYSIEFREVRIRHGEG